MVLYLGTGATTPFPLKWTTNTGQDKDQENTGKMILKNVQAKVA
jgi:hypothetical protein